MCIGNFFSDWVLKKEVFVVFSKYGRLVQIFMKSVYGFVQYYNVFEVQVVLEVCQDMEFGGCCICECVFVFMKNYFLINLLYRF